MSGTADTLTLEALKQAQAKLLSVSPLPALRFVPNSLLYTVEEDWSEVRSPSRAARRRKQGHKQRIRIWHKPDPKFYHLDDGTVIAHPETIRFAQAELAKRSEVKARQMHNNLFYGAFT